ncbi:YggT family protein [Candidatus Hydrogenisulfobacillus filiaventi]|uniref:YggT family protein n=1 Tax=Candidatus Hydrogenisulfobacillus filiaventi TaxID=2707344 RepID=A0A6F8ZEX2_9FIRM|nr:YggT family protein [Bacillota bacterium]CAB1128481.1 YggT family protein [Candidatus Hydrogenisulfobacillus filiaventi]
MSVVLLNLASSVRILTEIFFVVLVVRIVASYLPPRGPGLWAWVAEVCERLTEPVLRPIRERVPAFGSLDLSPLLAMVLVDILGYILIRLLELAAGV